MENLPLVKKLRLSAIDYYTIHLSIVNTLFQKKLTHKEIEVLAFFMTLDGDIVTRRFETTSRKIAKQSLGLSDAGLSNYIRTLTEKGFLYKKDNTLQIVPQLHPKNDYQEYQIKIYNIG